MPVYTFACPKCGLAVNKVSQVQDASPKCPYCHLEMDRQIKSCGFVLKGQDFMELIIHVINQNRGVKYANRFSVAGC